MNCLAVKHFLMLPCWFEPATSIFSVKQAVWVRLESVSSYEINSKKLSGLGLWLGRLQPDAAPLGAHGLGQRAIA